jgi:hypothetical protein
MNIETFIPLIFLPVRWTTDVCRVCAIMTLPATSLEEEVQRKIRAINATVGVGTSFSFHSVCFYNARKYYR